MKGKGLMSAYGFVLLLGFSCFGQEQGLPATDAKIDIQTLERGQTVEREIGGVYTRHLFSFDLSAGQFVKIEAEQNGCDVIFALMSEDKLNVFDVNNESTEGIESATAAVEKAGNYQLQVMSVADKKGAYKLKITELRTATEKEVNLTAGIVLSNDAFNKATTSAPAEVILQSISKLEVALKKFRLAEAKSFEARAQSSIGARYEKLGYVKKAIEYYTKAVEISYSIEDKYEISVSLGKLGSAYQADGDWQKASDALFESLKLRREGNNRREEAASLNKIGNFLRQLGDNDRALNYFQQALIILQQEKIWKNYEAETHQNIGAVYLSRKEFEKARESFQKALETAKQTKSRRREATFLNSLGKVTFILGDTAKALVTLNEALKISRELSDKLIEAASLKNLGQIYFALSDTESASEVLNKALETYSLVADKRNLAETLLLSAKVESKKGNLQSAQAKTEEAISLIETIRSRVQNTELRDSFAANLQDFYTFQIDLLMLRHKLEPNKDFAALAFQANERARARGLLNLLAESNANIREGIDARLLQKETELKNVLSARLENLTKALNSKSPAEETGNLKIEIERVAVEYEQIQAQIRKVSPRYSALTQPETLNLKEIQTEVLDTDSVVLEYALGETKSFLWIVTKTDFRVLELPAGDVIERTARQYYESLTARNKSIKFETPAERDERIFRADSDLVKFSGELSRMIVTPAAPFLVKKRVLIVADGALQYVPFATLSLGGGEHKDQGAKIKNRFLVETNEIVNLPSASVLAVLRKETLGRRSAPKTLAVLADPIFNKEDERFRMFAKKNELGRKPENRVELIPVARKQTRTAGDSDPGGRLDLVRLPFTRREAEMISSLVPANQQEKLLDFAASRQSAMSSELSNYRFVHFATHGFINSENPELSGVVLSLFDENGKEQDGFLRVGDIYNLKLPAEMVVLSGCKTGLGKEIKGEGLVGLTRGFMFAGAKRVAVSLWDVNDEATAELMGRFYREMLGTKNLSPASALRHAQIAMIKDKRWNNPYFWAAFVLQGESK